MVADDLVSVSALGVVGIAGGLVLMVRGMDDYRSSLRVADTSTSSIASIAAGEVRISGTIEMAETTLVSPIERVPCVYFRTTVEEGRTPLSSGHRSTEERSIGFRVRDATGSIRVFPHGARVDAPEKPPSFEAFRGTDPAPADAAQDGAAAVDPEGPGALENAVEDAMVIASAVPSRTAWTSTPGMDGSQRYHEIRLEIGDPVTIVGRALPFGDLPDPTAADAGSGSDPVLDDPEIAADIAAAPPRARSPTTRRPPGGTQPSRGSGSGTR